MSACLIPFDHDRIDCREKPSRLNLINSAPNLPEFVTIWQMSSSMVAKFKALLNAKIDIEDHRSLEAVLVLPCHCAAINVFSLHSLGSGFKGLTTGKRHFGSFFTFAMIETVGTETCAANHNDTQNSKINDMLQVTCSP